MRSVALGVALVATAAGCSVDNTAPTTAQLRTLDLDSFACDVQPVLVRRCSMLACHGQAGHALRLYSPGKLRLGAARTLVQRDAPLTDDELHANYCSARGLAPANDPTDATVLLHKTLAPAVGGGEHKGGVIFRSLDDPDYQKIRGWLDGKVQGPLPAGGCGPLMAHEEEGCS